MTIKEINTILTVLKNLVGMADENKLPQAILDAINFEEEDHMKVEVGLTWRKDELVFMFLCWSQIGVEDNVYLTRKQLYPLLLKDL